MTISSDPENDSGCRIVKFTRLFNNMTLCHLYTTTAIIQNYLLPIYYIILDEILYIHITYMR